MKFLRHFLLMILLGILVGLLGSLFRLALEYAVYLVNLVVYRPDSFLLKIVISALLTCFLVFMSWKAVGYLAPETAGSGVQEVERTLIDHTQIKWWRVIPVKFGAGLMALGAKLLLGREGPTIHLGASAGAMISKWFGLSNRDTNCFIGAGAAAGLATAFNAPLAGILFIFEEMRPSFRMTWTHLQCVTTVSVVAILVLYAIVGNKPAIPMAVYVSPPLMSYIIFLLFGFLMGGAGWFFNVALMKLLHIVDKFTPRTRQLYILGSAALIGVCAVISPYLVSGGYEILEHVLQVPMHIDLLLIALVLRFGFGLVSYSMGVPGGIFAPILALGSMMGLLFFTCFPTLCSAMGIQPGMLALAGMGGLFAAVVRSPLTTVILIIEMTKNGSMVLPLLETCIVSSMFINWLGNKPIYTQLLRRSEA